MFGFPQAAAPAAAAPVYQAPASMETSIARAAAAAIGTSKTRIAGAQAALARPAGTLPGLGGRAQAAVRKKSDAAAQATIAQESLIINAPLTTAATQSKVYAAANAAKTRAVAAAKGGY